MKFDIEDRVVTVHGEVGILESIDPDGVYCDVRLLTPKNTPSTLITMTTYADLKDGFGILPMPRSDEWHREARAFNGFLHEVLRDVL